MAGAGRFVRLGAALAAAGAMLFATSPGPSAAVPPVDARAAWPSAQRSTIPAELGDGTSYEPLAFLEVNEDVNGGVNQEAKKDATESVGVAPTADGKFQRLLIRHANGSVRVLRSVAMSQTPSFNSPVVAGQALVWAENTRTTRQIMSAGLRDARPPRRLTGDVGDARFNRSEHDLVVAEGRVHWVAAGPGDITEVRSVALTGGRVDVRPQHGSWALSAWPWLVDGVTAAAGTTRLRNLKTGQDRPIASPGRGAAACSPTWCRAVFLDRDGYPEIDLMRPDGADRRKVASGTAETVIADVAVLDRFEVFAQQTASSELTGNVQLMIYEIATNSVLEVSPDATAVSYRAGILWWSTGNLDSFVRHALDLRTV